MTGGKHDGEFSQFWSAYPKKQGKAAARKAFDKALRKSDPQTLLNAMEAQKRSDQWTRDGGRYIPLASTWLNGERWNDELDPTHGQTVSQHDPPRHDPIIDYTKLRFDENGQPLNLEECTS